MEFFLPMAKVPNVTHQEKRIAVKNGKPVVYEDARLRDARNLYTALLARYKPEDPISGAVALKTVWMFEPTGKHKSGDFKTTKPDTDNLVKLFKDCMTRTGFWLDDAQVVDEHTIKGYGPPVGVYVKVEEIGEVYDGTGHKTAHGCAD